VSWVELLSLVGLRLRGVRGATASGINIAAEGLLVLLSCPCFSGGRGSGSEWWGRFCCPFSFLMTAGASGACGGSVIVAVCITAHRVCAAVAQLPFSEFY